MRKHFKSTCSKRKHWDFRIARYGCEKSGHSKGEPSLNSERNKDANPEKIIVKLPQHLHAIFSFPDHHRLHQHLVLDCSHHPSAASEPESVTWQSALVHSALMLIVTSVLKLQWDCQTSQKPNVPPKTKALLWIGLTFCFGTCCRRVCQHRWNKQLGGMPYLGNRIAQLVTR